MRVGKVLFLGIFMFTLVQAKAQTDMANARALFIYNFLRHIKWPENSVGDAYVIGVIGNTPTFETLKKYTKGRQVGIKPIRIVKYNSVNEINDCQILLIAESAVREIPSIINKTDGKGCLVVGERVGTSNKGASIDFQIVDNKLKFAINEENTRKQNLVISRSLLDMSI